MNLALIVILAVVIIVVSIITAFGKAVGAGGNISDLFPGDEKGIKTEVTENESIVKPESNEFDDNDAKEESTRKRKSQIFRTIGGLLFGVLLLCPILYRHRINGEPFININHQVRDLVVSLFVVTEIVVFLIIWNIDRKPQK